MLIVPEIRNLDASNLKEALELLRQTPLQPINHNNWKEKFPYAPEVGFRIAYHDQELFICFSVQEECTMALIQEDNGEVWTDSCVEFFLALDDSGYYNFEFSCIGKALLGFRKERPNAVHAPADIMHAIKRFSTLGKENFSEKKIAGGWELIVAIPTNALFRHNISTWKELSPRVNVYKCGDKLSQPHYLSWAPIDTPAPDFHVPRCFSALSFK